MLGITMTSSSMSKLGDFLRARREAITPAEVGLPTGLRRKTPGLRREEVAVLAAISPTYLAFLEQGRPVRPSPQVLDSLAAALHLSPAERDYIHTLVHGASPGPEPELAETLTPEVTQLVDRLDPHPTYVTGRRWDILAANRAARLLWTDWNVLPLGRRNLLLWMFTAPKAREVFVEWETEAAAQLARYRAASVRHQDSASFHELNQLLKANSHHARALWQRHDIAPLSSGEKLLRHDQLGELQLRHTVLQIADNPEQKIVTFTPAPADRQRITALIAADSSRAQPAALAGSPKSSDPRSVTASVDEVPVFPQRR